MLHLFNFTILFGMLYILLYKPVKDFMAKREAVYAEMDAKANENLRAAEETRREYDDKVHAFNEELQEQRNKARQDIQALTDKQLAEANEEAQKIVADARADAARQKDEIVASAQKEITDLVSDAMEKISIGSASDAFDQFLDTAESETPEYDI